MPPQTPAQPDPYNFILAPPPQKPRFSFGLAGSMKQRIMVIVGVFMVLIVLTIVAGNLLGGPAMPRVKG